MQRIFTQEAGFQDSLSKRFIRSDYARSILSKEDIIKVENKELRLVDASPYVRRNLSALGSDNDLIKPSDVEVEGINSFNQAELAKHENLIVKGIFVGYASLDSDETVTEDAIRRLRFSNIISDNVPAEFLNSEIEIYIKDNKVFTERVGMMMIHGGVEKCVKDAIYNLTNLRLLPGARTLKIKFKPVTSMPAGKHHFVEVALIGDKTEAK